MFSADRADRTDNAGLVVVEDDQYRAGRCHLDVEAVNFNDSQQLFTEYRAGYSPRYFIRHHPGAEARCHVFYFRIFAFIDTNASLPGQDRRIYHIQRNIEVFPQQADNKTKCYAFYSGLGNGSAIPDADLLNFAGSDSAE